jgi:uncharacterized membrane protein YbhN (UPF0104 family)
MKVYNGTKKRVSLVCFEYKYGSIVDCCEYKYCIVWCALNTSIVCMIVVVFWCGPGSLVAFLAGSKRILYRFGYINWMRGFLMIALLVYTIFLFGFRVGDAVGTLPSLTLMCRTSVTYETGCI